MALAHFGFSASYSFGDIISLSLMYILLCLYLLIFFIALVLLFRFTL